MKDSDFKNFANQAWNLRKHYEMDNVQHSELKVSIVSQIMAKIIEEGDFPSHLIITSTFSNSKIILDISKSVLADLELKKYHFKICDKSVLTQSVSSVLFEKH